MNDPEVRPWHEDGENEGNNEIKGPDMKANVVI